MKHPARYAAVAALILIIGVFYYRSIFFQFVGDDYYYLLRMEASSNIHEALKFLWQPTVLSVYFRPMAWLPYFTGYLVDPHVTVWFHFLSITLHIFNVLIVYFTARYLTGSGIVAFFAALIFGLHPINSEVVTFVAIFGDIAFTFFCLISLILFALFCAGNNVKAYLFSLIAYTLALLSKEAAAITPLLIIMTGVALYKLKGIRLKNPWAIAPYFAITAFYLILRPVSQLGILSLMPSPQKALKLVYYIRDLVIPFEVIPLKNFVYQNMPVASFLAVSLLALILSVWLFFKRFKEPMAYLPLIWIGLTLLIPLAIPFSPVRRHLYLPLVGYSIFLSYIVYAASKKKLLFISLLSVFLIAGGIETQRRNSLYEYAGDLVHSSLAQLKKEMPVINKNATVFLVGLPGTVDNTYVFWSSPEDKIRFVYKDMGLPAHCLSVINFRKENIPEARVRFLDNRSFTYELDTDLYDYIRPAGVNPAGEGWTKEGGGVEYNIAGKDKYGNINKMTFRFPGYLYPGKEYLILGWKEGAIKLLGTIKE